MPRQNADVAQLVEQLIRNQQVIGSSPIVGSILMFCCLTDYFAAIAVRSCALRAPSGAFFFHPPTIAPIRDMPISE
jgi:hypothetical protein